MMARQGLHLVASHQVNLDAVIVYFHSELFHLLGDFEHDPEDLVDIGHRLRLANIANEAPVVIARATTGELFGDEAAAGIAQGCFSVMALAIGVAPKILQILAAQHLAAQRALERDALQETFVVVDLALLLAVGAGDGAVANGADKAVGMIYPALGVEGVALDALAARGAFDGRR